jgi:hypothetical protein
VNVALQCSASNTGAPSAAVPATRSSDGRNNRGLRALDMPRIAGRASRGRDGMVCSNWSRCEDVGELEVQKEQRLRGKKPWNRSISPTDSRQAGAHRDAAGPSGPCSAFASRHAGRGSTVSPPPLHPTCATIEFSPRHRPVSLSTLHNPECAVDLHRKLM